jgi:hypothetical protein
MSRAPSFRIAASDPKMGEAASRSGLSHFVSISSPIAKGKKPGVGIQLGKQDPPW